MFHRPRAALIAFAAILPALLAAPALAEDARTTAAGVYSQAQAERGLVVYEEHCVMCHAADMAGGGAGSPPLKGQAFMIGWRGESVGFLLEQLRLTMPTGMAGSLTDQEYADVLAAVLAANGLPASAYGAELATDPAEMMDVTIE